MRLSEDKVMHLSHIAFDALVKSGASSLTSDDYRVRKEIRNIITKWLKTEEEIEEAVRKTIRSYSRGVVEGSPEYDVLFQKHYKEEMGKRGKL